MKNIITLLAFIFIFTSCNRNIKGPLADYHQLRYSNTFNVPGKSQEDIYIYFQEWYIKTFRAKYDVIQVDNIDRGLIVSRYITSVIVDDIDKYFIKHTLTIRADEGRYNLTFQHPSYGKGLESSFRPITRQTNVLKATQAYWDSTAQVFLKELSY